MEIKYHIGRKCNLRCNYCHVEKVIDDEPDYIESLRSVVNNIEDVNKISRILITGGEPTLYHDKVLNLLNEFQNIKRINIASNGTSPDYLVQYSLKFKNVVVSVSWDGHENERGFDSINSIKFMTECGVKFNVLYVISNTNYTNMYNDILELSRIIPNVESFLELLFVMLPEAEYNMNLDVLEEQIRKTYIKFPHLNIFKRDKNRKCPVTYSDDYQIEIRDGIIYKGCINYSYNKTQAIYKLGDCTSELENKCLKCDVDVCHACANTVVGKFTEMEESHMYDGKYYNSMYCKFFRIVQKVVDEENRNSFLREKILIDAQNLTLLVTDKCSLRCTYCVEKNMHDSNVMSKDVIDSVVKVMHDSKNITDLTLFGGEPLMKENIGILNYLKDKLIENNTRVNIIIITNGQDLCDSDITNFIKSLLENGFGVRIQVSIDNLKDSNDSRRITLDGESAYKKAMNGVCHIGNIVNKKHVSINSVINYDELDSFYEWCLYLDKLVKTGTIGSFSVRFNQVEDKPLSIIQQRKFTEFYNKISDDYIKGVISRRSFKAIMNINNITCDDGLVRQNHGCGAGINSFAVNTNGDIMICYMMEDKPLGNIKDNISSFNNVYELFDEVSVCGQFRSFGKSCNSCKDFESCIKCKIGNIKVNGNARDNNMTNCKNVKDRNSIMRSYGISIMDFKRLNQSEIDDLVSDIKELEKYYKDEENVLTDDEKTEIIESVILMKERLSD